jgi:SAM-dependent methyltransferase
MLPPPLVRFFDDAFIRAHFFYAEFVYRLALRVARETGLEAALREPGTAEEIVARAGLDPGRAPVAVDVILRLLAERGAIEEVAGGPPGRYRAGAALPQLDPQSIRDQEVSADPAWLPSYALMETVAQEYPAFLRGAVSGEDVLFSPRRLRLWVDYFSNGNRLYAINNQVGAVAVAEWLPRDGGTVLELGGGLGSGALALMQELEARGRLEAIGEYRFTELVPAFLRRGQQALEARPRTPFPIRFGPLDMNRPFAEQGVAPGSVAVVYAVNTLHVAHDLAFTLGEALRALEPGGRLIVSECLRPFPRQPIHAEFVFSLAETFRSPRLHPVYRPNGGFLTAEQWRDAMGAAGFADVCFLPDAMEVRNKAPDFFVGAVGATRP